MCRRFRRLFLEREFVAVGLDMPQKCLIGIWRPHDLNLNGRLPAQIQRRCGCHSANKFPSVHAGSWSLSV
jgi:hypothetical protein